MSRQEDAKSKKDRGVNANDDEIDQIQKQIGKKLQDSYQDLVNEPVPDRFAELLKQLREKDKSGSGETS